MNKIKLRENIFKYAKMFEMNEVLNNRIENLKAQSDIEALTNMMKH